MLVRTGVFLLGCVVMLSSQAEPVTLEQLEGELLRAPSVRAAQAELDYRTSLLSRDLAGAGWSVISGVSLSHQIDRVIDSEWNNSQPARAYIGLSVPLLGSRAEERRALTESAQDVAIQSSQVDLQTGASLRSLRDYYVIYWTSQQQLAALDRLQASFTSYDQQLQARLDAQLLLASEYYEFRAVMARIDRERAAFELSSQRALAQMNWLTTGTLTEFDARAPDYPAVCVDVQAVQAYWLAEAPRLKQAEEELIYQANRVADSRWSGVDSQFSLVQSFEHRFQNRQDDTEQSELRASFDITFPLNWNQYRRDAARSRIDAWVAGRTALEAEQVSQLERVFNGYENLSQQRYRYRTSLKQLLAQNELLREVQLRFDASQSIELVDFINAHVGYYQAVIGWLDARSGLALAVNQWRPMAEFRCQDQWQFNPTTSLGDLTVAELRVGRAPQLVGIDPGGYQSRGLLVWKATDWLARLEADPTLFTQLRRDSGVTSVSISFTSEELGTFSGQPFKLMPLFLEAEKAGVTVNLLLGEPLWILPEGRQDLLDILGQLKGLPFERLYLDLELNQLAPEGQLEGEGHWRELVETLTVVVKESDWPVAWITHDRYLSGTDDECRLCTIETTGVEEVALMIFSTAPETVIRRAQSLLNAPSAMTFSLVVSVESELPAENSFYSSGMVALELGLARIAGGLTSPRFVGFHLQSWDSFRMMAP